jgi:hypothetical protein
LANKNEANRHKLHLPRKKMLLNRMRENSTPPNFFTRFLYGEVASQSTTPQKKTFWVKNFLFYAKVVLGMSEPPGVFFIEQAQEIIGGSKPAPWRGGLFIVHYTTAVFASRIA